MKTTTSLFLAALFLSSSSMADYKMANLKKTIECQGEDNQTWTLNAQKNSMTYTVEGETAGPEKIEEKSISYTTTDGTLTLSDKGDTFKSANFDEPQSVTCKVKIKKK